MALLLLFVIGAHGFRGALRTGVDLGFQPAFQFLFGGGKLMALRMAVLPKSMALCIAVLP